MIDINALSLQLLDIAGVKELVKWAQIEGWNPGPYDAEVFYKTDKQGFYGYYYKSELIAGGAIVSYSGKYGFMGLFIVKPEFRGIGLGKKLWYQRRDLLLTRLEKTASIGMDGVVDMQTFYSKGGFKIAFIDKRYERSGNEFKIDANISNIIPSDFDKIIDYDSECFGLARPQFLIPWLNMPGSFYYKYEENSKIKGFAVLRKATIGYKIGPLYADNALIADELYKACLNSVIDESVFMDIPMNNNEAVELVLRYDAKYVFECARMYYGQPLKAHHGKVFALTTFELG